MVTRSAIASLTSIRIIDARRLSPADLLNAVKAAYTGIFQLSTGQPVRFWNVVPGINDPVSGGQSRYMNFNAGRFAAFLDRFETPDRFDALVPTASGVGHVGDDLWVHGLFVDRPVTHFGNPRQRSPHRYGRQFGNRPPCFARATRVDDLLVVGGTASIKDQQSVYADLASQLDETLLNLVAVIEAGGGPPSLDTVTDVRVYHPHPADAGDLRRMLAGAFPSARRVDYYTADLCRPELLVEIEVVAEVG